VCISRPKPSSNIIYGFHLFRFSYKQQDSFIGSEEYTGDLIFALKKGNFSKNNKKEKIKKEKIKLGR
jgi:hypothetical protein